MVFMLWLVCVRVCVCFVDPITICVIECSLYDSMMTVINIIILIMVVTCIIGCHATNIVLPDGVFFISAILPTHVCLIVCSQVRRYRSSSYRAYSTLIEICAGVCLYVLCICVCCVVFVSRNIYIYILCIVYRTIDRLIHYAA